MGLNLSNESRMRCECFNLLRREEGSSWWDVRINSGCFECLLQPLGETRRELECSVIGDQTHDVLCSLDESLAVMTFFQMSF